MDCCCMRFVAEYACLLVCATADTCPLHVELGGAIGRARVAGVVVHSQTVRCGFRRLRMGCCCVLPLLLCCLAFTSSVSHGVSSASELLSSSGSALAYSPAPFSTLYCRSASLCPPLASVSAAAAVFRPADIAAASGFEHFLFSMPMWTNMFLPWTTSETGDASSEPPQLFFDHDSTLDSCHLFLRFSPDWVVVLVRVQHLRQRVLLQARAMLPDVCSLAVQSICEKAPDCFLVYSGESDRAISTMLPLNPCDTKHNCRGQRPCGRCCAFTRGR